MRSSISLSTSMLLLAAANAETPLLSWSLPPFNFSDPLGGLPRLPNASTSVVFFGSDENGGYNHGAMLAYHDSLLHLAWKNGVNASGEDAPGQRVRFSQSADGITWSPSAIIFPSLSTPALPVALFAGPFAVVKGHLYASASAAVIATGDAQGSQFCLWPDGVDPRNAGPPGQPQPVGVLLLRRVLPGIGALGPPFWAAASVPHGFAPASAAAGLLTLPQMDATTRADMVALLDPAMKALPCADPATGGTLKCEAVLHGAQEYETLPRAAALANERSHWVVRKDAQRHAGADVLVYRSHSGALWTSVREAGGSGEWGSIELSPIPNDDSNINSGVLPSGAAFIAANAVPHRQRNPLTLAVAKDGTNFTSCAVLMDCNDIAHNSTCTKRGAGGASGGPSYPQALSVVAPAPELLRGFYVVATNNKEDVVVARFPWSALGEAASA